MKKSMDIRPYTRQFYRGNWGLLALGVVEILLMVAANLVISWGIQQIIDLLGGMDTGFSLTEVTLLAIGALGLLLVGYGIAYISEPRFIARAMAQYKDYVFSRICKKSIFAFSGENSAMYISALSNDAQAIENGYLNCIFTVLFQVVQFVATLVLMLYYSPILTLVSLCVAVLPLAASVLTGNVVAAAERQVSDRNQSYMSMLKDSLAGFSVIKAFRAEVQICRLFAQEVMQLAAAKERRKKMVTLVDMAGSVAGVTLQFGVMLIGAWLAISGSAISAGTVMVFVQLLNYVLNPIRVIPRCLAERKAARGLIEKLALSLEENVREEGEKERISLEKGIVLEHLTFGYEPGKPVLQDVDVTFAAGKSYAIVGASGCGKSTLLSLLMAGNRGYEGQILYDDTPLQDIRSEALYDTVSQVQQNVFIFNASIRDNITMFADFPEEAVNRAVELSGLAALVAEKGEGYLCGENGSNLSGGEKQRISIARSLLKNAKVLLVDEATAALDARTAWQVSNAILGLEGMTRIVVTHSLEEGLLKQYDGILTLKAGKVVEQGSFAELMEQKGYFYSLFTVSQ